MTAYSVYMGSLFLNGLVNLQALIFACMFA
jgi:hypothetical protein